MNINTTTAAIALSGPGNEELVIENLGQQSAERFQPGTCICWVDRSLTD